MNTVFVAIDGDDIGAKVGQSVLHNDPSTLADISQKLTAGLDVVRQWAEAHQGHVVSLGGDEGVLVFENVEDEESFLNEIENLRQAYLETTGATITAGTGFSLSEAGKALLAGKLSGKDMVVPYGEEIEDILHDAHQHVLEGEGSEEEQKLDDHYISHIDESDDQDADQADMGSEDQEMVDDNSDPEMYSDDQEGDSEDMYSEEDSDMGEQEESPDMYSEESEMDQDSMPQDEEGQQESAGQYVLHHGDDQEGDVDEQQDMDLDQGDFDYNPDDYESESDELPEEETQAEAHSEGDLENQTMEGLDGGAEEVATGAPDAEEEPDEFSSSTEDMQGRVDDLMGTPEMQDEENAEQEEEQPIEIPESENMEPSDEMESQEIPMESDEIQEDGAEVAPEGAQQDPSVEMDAFNQMLSDSGQNVAKMKQQVAASLSAFKEQKDQLVAIQDQVPELYEATLGMLQTMLDLSKAVFGGGEEEADQEIPQDDQQEEASPDIAEGVPDEYMEQEPAPKF